LPALCGLNTYINKDIMELNEKIALDLLLSTTIRQEIEEIVIANIGLPPEQIGDILNKEYPYLRFTESQICEYKYIRSGYIEYVYTEYVDGSYRCYFMKFEVGRGLGKAIVSLYFEIALNKESV